MRYDVELIVGANATDLDLRTQGLIAGATITNPCPIGYWSSNHDDWSIGSQIVLTDTNDPNTWTVLATLTVVSIDFGTDTFTYTTADTIDPDTIYNTALYKLINVSAVTVLDLYENEVISQNWRFSDLQTFEALGSFSRQFRIPASKRNLAALGYLPDANFKADVDYFQTKLPAELRVQTLPIASGYLRVMRVITQADKLADFEVTFYAESPDLFNKIAGKQLKDIAALASLEVPVTHDEVINASGYPYLYTLADRGQMWSEGNESGRRSIFAKKKDTAPKAGDLTPALNWQWIFEKIIEEAGFTYEGVNIDNILLRYYAPWCNTPTLFKQTSQSAAFGVYLDTTLFLPFQTTQQLTSVTESYDNGGNVVGNVFTAPVTGYYSFRYWWTIHNLGFDYIHRFKVFFTNLTTGTTIQVQLYENLIDTANYDSSNTALPFFLSTGDQFTVEYYSLFDFTSLDPGLAYNTGTGFELYDLKVCDGGILDWSLNAPEVSQADFLRDVFNMHCCVVVPDRLIPNKLIIEPANTYIGTGSDRDWSGKLDISKDITLSNTSEFQNKRLTFTYSAGEEQGSKLYVDAGRIYGDYTIENFTVSENDVPNDFARDGEQKIQLTTQSTPCNYIKGTNIIIPKFVSAEGTFVNPKLRCLFNASVVEMVLWNYQTGTADVSAVIPILNHYELGVPTSLSDFDLNWAPEVPLFIIPFSPYNTLYNLYWRDYLNQLYSPQARVMEAYFALDLSDILSFKFSDRIWIKDSWWRILDINDYKVGDSETVQVRLLKIIDAVPETSVVPDGVSDGGIISFVDRAGNPAAGTRSACTRYGYQWDPATNTCFAVQPYTPLPTAPENKIGLSSNEVSNSSNSIVMTNALDNSDVNDYVIAAGYNQKLVADNSMSIAVGENQKMEGTGGVAMFGRNVYTKTSGQHLGGGYMNNAAASSPDGYAQSGVVMHQSKYTFTAAGQQFIYLNGIIGEHLELPDDTVWSCVLNYTIQDDNLTGNYETGQLSFALIKSGGIAAVSAITPINVIGGIGAHVFAIGINVAVTNLHRMYYTVSGGSFPDTFHIVTSLTYTQSKLS